MNVQYHSMNHYSITALSFVLASTVALPASAQNQAWIRQLGTSGSDSLFAAASDGSGGVYVGGHTEGNLAAPLTGLFDAWLARYDSAGNQVWIRQFGTSHWDNVTAAAADAIGGVYVSGSTWGNLGAISAGVSDAWLARYDGAGNQVWIRQLGTSSADGAYAAAPDGAGGVYVGGRTAGALGAPNAGDSDCWLARYDGVGNQIWIRQFGTSAYDDVSAAAADGTGGVCIGGTTSGSLAGTNAGGQDAWLARFDSAGNQIWIRQLGTSVDDKLTAAAGAATGAGYVSGITRGNLGAPNYGGEDAWLARYDGAGNQAWIRQLGTSVLDRSYACTQDGSGGVYLSGYTGGSLGGPSAGNNDVWLARYDVAGTQAWIRQMGTSSNDQVFAAAPSGQGGAYLGGLSEGDFATANAGLGDAWLALHEGISIYCAAKLNSLGCLPAIAFSGSPNATSGSGFMIRCTNVRNSKIGLLFYGVSGRSALPFQGGTLCVGAPIKRTGATNSGGTPLPASDCSGVYAIDMNQFAASSGPPTPLPELRVAGTTVQCQWWGRDPGFASPNNSTLSNAIEFVVGY